MTGPVDALLDITGYFVAASAGPRGLSAWDVIPSGQTVTGEIGYDTHGGTDASSDALIVNLPGVAPVPLDTLTVNFDPNSGAADADPTCVGTLEAPTAPTGQVCIYLGASGGFDLTSLSGDIASLTTRSFFVGWVPANPDLNPNAALEYDEFLFASWAYTAP